MTTPGTWPAIAFASATYDSMTGFFLPGDLAPEEIVLHEVTRRLKANSTLTQLFTADRIHAVAGLQRLDSLGGNRLLVTLNTNDPTEHPTAIDYNNLRVSIVQRTELVQQSKPILYGEASQITVAAYIRTVLNAHDPIGVNNKMLPVTLPGGSTVALAAESNPGAITFQEVQVSETQWIGDYIQPWIYRIDVEHDSGRIRSLVLEGAYNAE
jgi:hypothetical protein